MVCLKNMYFHVSTSSIYSMCLNTEIWNYRLIFLPKYCNPSLLPSLSSLLVFFLSAQHVDFAYVTYLPSKGQGVEAGANGNDSIKAWSSFSHFSSMSRKKCKMPEDQIKQTKNYHFHIKILQFFYRSTEPLNGQYFFRYAHARRVNKLEHGKNRSLPSWSTMENLWYYTEM